MKTAIYIEDNDANAVLLIKRLRTQGMIVIAAPDVTSGINFVQSHQPDLIFMDYNLPGMNGVEGVARLRAYPSTAHIPVVMLTADTCDTLRRRALAAGADAFLNKPVAREQLLAVIETLIAPDFRRLIV